MEPGDITEFWRIENILRILPVSEVNFRITGFGGDVFEINKFNRAVQDAQAQGKVINMDVIGPSYSGHAYILCYADNLKVRDGASIMFHAASSEDGILFGLIPIRVLTSDPELNALMQRTFDQCKKVGLLDDKDIQTIQKGDDVVLTQERGVRHKYYLHDSADSGMTFTALIRLLLNLSVICVIIGLLKKV